MLLYADGRNCECFDKNPKALEPDRMLTNTEQHREYFSKRVSSLLLADVDWPLSPKGELI